MAVMTAIAIASAGAALAGTAMQYEGSQKAASASKDAAFKQYQIAQQQISSASIQQSNAQNLAAAQINIADIQRQQNVLGIQTNKDVIAQQMLLDQNRLLQQKNIDADNQFKLDATVKQEQIAEQNDILNTRNDTIQHNIFALNQQKDALDRATDVQNAQLEALQARTTALAAVRQQRDIVRQGIAARSSAAVQAVAAGQQAAGSTRGQAQQATIASREAMGIQGSLQDRELAQAALGANVNKRLFGVQQREIGVQQRQDTEQQYDLGIESRNLGIQSRQLNYGVALNQFSTTAANAQLTENQFDLNKNISNIYLASQDANAQLVQQAYAANTNLINVNQINTTNALESQKRVYALGGDVSILNQSAASAQGLSGIGTGLQSLGSVGAKNLESFDRVFNNMTPTSNLKTDYSADQTAAGIASSKMGVEGAGVYS